MKRFFALAILALSPVVADAAPLTGKIFLAESNVANFDARTFAPGAPVDIYRVTLNNLLNTDPVTSLELSFPGAFVNRGSSQTTFRAPGVLPFFLGGNRVAETHFVTPFPTAELLAVNVTDSDTLLSAAYTRAGGGVFLPAGAPDTVVAVLSVDAGSTPPDFRTFTGRAAINGVLEPIFFVPEPTAGLLAGLTAVGLLARRV